MLAKSFAFLLLLPFAAAQFVSDYSYSQYPQNYYPQNGPPQDPVDARFRLLEAQVSGLTKKVEHLEGVVRDLTTAMHDDWVNSDSGSKYKIFELRRSWDDATSTCKTYNARLAVIDGVEKNTFVRELMKNTTSNVDFAWIGMRTRAEVASQPAKYTNFDADTQISGCAVIDRAGLWSIRSCNQLRPFVCQQVNVF
ncbi:unnamed protein product, partial [Mesorhabditis spiculigera]